MSSHDPTSATPAAVDADAFVSAARASLDTLVDTQRDAIKAAARVIARGVRDGGVVQAFGTGHSEAVALEIAGRAGGLVPTNKLALRDVVLTGDVDPASLDVYAERDPAIGRQVLERATVRPQDVFVLASNSGGNGSLVEVALLVKERGHPLIALTSLAHSRAITARHPSGRRLFEIADIVIDNGAPYGDAVLDLPTGGRVCAVSSLTSVLAVQMMVAETVALLLAEGVEPPLYVSSNTPGADARNEQLEARYAGRLRRGPF